LRAAGFETVMVNCNPETVSTDYDTSDRLFFEPLTSEDVLNVCERLQDAGGSEETSHGAVSDGRSPERTGGSDERPRGGYPAEQRVRPRKIAPLAAAYDASRGAEAHTPGLAGVIVSLGGQTPLKLAHLLENNGIPVLGTSPSSIDLAEDRERFNALCEQLGIPQPEGGTATEVEDALKIANGVGYPVLVRPSYVLGGRAMQIVYDDADLRRAMLELTDSGSLGREGGLSRERPALIDRFLEDAVEVDVDALRDRTGGFLIGGVMEHIEEAGVHSGDSACAIPPPTLSADVVRTIEQYTHALADALEVVGMCNVQYAVKDGQVFVIEANPRASRTVPFVSKATGVPLAKIAARLMLGATLDELRVEGLVRPPAEGGHCAVKEAVLPFNRFPTVDTILGPEMRSTGEVMGIDRSFGMAFAKSQAGAGNRLPGQGGVFLSLADRDKDAGLLAARRFAELGFSIAATAGTANVLEASGIPVDTIVAKVGEEVGVDAVDLISSGKVDLVVNTPRGRGPRADGMHIRRAALAHGVACVTTVSAAIAAAAGIGEEAAREPEARSLQEYHADGQLRFEV
jgi:carbamoyl-phosphate synthase large subunit